MPDPALTAEEVAHRAFALTFRGFDPVEVRTYLGRLAEEMRVAASRERELHRRLSEAEHRAAHPVLDEASLAQAVGEETSRVLASAQAAASELRARAQENVARILREAHEEAQKIRAQAECVLADRSQEAEAQANQIRRAAQVEAAAILERARNDALKAREQVESEARTLVEQAQAARAQVLGDLSRRRRIAQTQVEQLRAGRERLLEAYRVVRRTLDEVSDELERVEGEARQAAEAVGHRLAPPAGAEGAQRPPAHEAPGPEPAVPPEVAAAAERPSRLEEAPARGGAQGRHKPAPATGRPRSSLRILSRPATGQANRAPLDLAGGAEAGGHAPPATEVAVDPPASPEPPPAPEVTPEPPPGSEIPGEPPPGSEVAAEASTEGGGASPEGLSEVAAEPPAAGGEERDEADAPAGPPVEELFARIRAASQPGTGGLEVHPVEAGTNGHDRRPGPGAGAPWESASDAPVTDEDESLLQRRDALLEGIQARLTRKLKRALQDEQNEVLDRLRSARRPPAAMSLLPSPQEQAAPYALAALELLGEASGAVAAFAQVGVPEVDVSDLAGELSEAIARPLRRRLEEAIDHADNEGRDVLVERIGAAYRETKTQRSERLAGDAVIAAFSRGMVAALGRGAALRWVVEDEDGPCPDCDDNALAGPTPGGDTYPTGQLHPPAHAGCRCLLVQATP
jgi:DivIVA domain-containing protein